MCPLYTLYINYYRNILTKNTYEMKMEEISLDIRSFTESIIAIHPEIFVRGTAKKFFAGECVNNMQALLSNNLIQGRATLQ